MKTTSWWRPNACRRKKTATKKGRGQWAVRGGQFTDPLEKVYIRWFPVFNNQSSLMKYRVIALYSSYSVLTKNKKPIEHEK
jgi:hypothetical protein